MEEEETRPSASEEKVSNNNTTATEVKVKKPVLKPSLVEEKAQVKEPEKPQEPQ